MAKHKILHILPFNYPIFQLVPLLKTGTLLAPPPVTVEANVVAVAVEEAVELEVPEEVAVAIDKAVGLGLVKLLPVRIKDEVSQTEGDDVRELLVDIVFDSVS